jgi:hypothetical protein
MRTITLSKGLVTESVGDSILVLVPASGNTVELSGVLAETVLAIAAGETTQLDSDVITRLTELGIVTQPKRVSRRQVIRGGTLATGAGFAMLALPSVAHASSTPSRTVNGFWDQDSGDFYVIIAPTEVPEVSRENPDNFQYDTTTGEWSFDLQINGGILLVNYAYSYPGQGANENWEWTTEEALPNPRPTGNVLGVMKRNGQYFADVILEPR